jgi:hypothetical protein
MTTSREQLLAEIEAFIANHAMSATAFGEIVINDRHLVRRLRAGGSVTLDTWDRIRAFMADYKPMRARRGNGQPAVAA